MAKIEYSDAKAAQKIGSTWNTAVDLSGADELMHYESFDDGSTRAYIDTINASNEVTSVVASAYSANVQTTHKLGYHNTNLEGVACVFGNATGSPAEVTGSQGDYQHVMNLAASNLGYFQTLGFLVETDQMIEIASCKWNELTISAETNAVPQLTLSGVGGKVLYSGDSGASLVNVVGNITGLSAANVEEAVLAGTNHYVRINAAGGGAVGSGDDQEILSFEFRVSRPMDAVYPLRGATTPYNTEPTQLTPTEVTLAVQYAEIDDAKHDPRADRDEVAEKKCEIFMDGDQIASGENASIKIQIPSMYATEVGGYRPTRGQRFQPNAVYRCMTRSAAPTGMSHTAAAITVICERSASLLA